MLFYSINTMSLQTSLHRYQSCDMSTGIIFSWLCLLCLRTVIQPFLCNPLRYSVQLMSQRRLVSAAASSLLSIPIKINYCHTAQPIILNKVGHASESIKTYTMVDGSMDLLIEVLHLQCIRDTDYLERTIKYKAAITLKVNQCTILGRSQLQHYKRSMLQHTVSQHPQFLMRPTTHLEHIVSCADSSVNYI